MRMKTMGVAGATVAMVAGLSACETVQEEINEAIGYEYIATLAPVAGASGSGKAEISINDATNVICTDLELSTGVNMTAGQLRGPGGGTIINLDVPGDDSTDGGDNDAEDCDSVSDATVDAIRLNPTAYHVHISATTGDLRGTLYKQN